MPQNLFAPQNVNQLKQNVSSLLHGMGPITTYANAVEATHLSQLESYPVWYQTLSQNLQLMKGHAATWLNTLKPDFPRLLAGIVTYGVNFEGNTQEIMGGLFNVDPPSRQQVLEGCAALARHANGFKGNVDSAKTQFTTFQQGCQTDLTALTSGEHSIQQAISHENGEISSLEHDIQQDNAQIQQLKNQLGLGSQGGYTPATVREIHRLEAAVADDRNRLAWHRRLHDELTSLDGEISHLIHLNTQDMEMALVHIADFWEIVDNLLNEQVEDIEDMMHDAASAWENLRRTIPQDLELAGQDWMELARYVQGELSG